MKNVLGRYFYARMKHTKLIYCARKKNLTPERVQSCVYSKLFFSVISGSILLKTFGDAAVKIESGILIHLTCLEGWLCNNKVSNANLLHTGITRCTCCQTKP